MGETTPTTFIIMCNINYSSTWPYIVIFTYRYRHRHKKSKKGFFKNKYLAWRSEEVQKIWKRKEQEKRCNKHYRYSNKIHCKLLKVREKRKKQQKWIITRTATSKKSKGGR